MNDQQCLEHKMFIAAEGYSHTAYDVEDCGGPRGVVADEAGLSYQPGSLMLAGLSGAEAALAA